MPDMIGPQRGVTKNSGKPMEIAEVELYKQDEDGAYVSTGETVEVPSLLFFHANHWCVVNDYAPSGGSYGRYLCAPGDEVV